MAKSSNHRPLYAVLSVAPEATSNDIARAYRRLALQYHPDRNPEGVETFKKISNAYSILSDKEKRAIYDATGIATDEHPDDTAAVNRQQRSAELASQVNNFFRTYAGSSEETDDVVKCFQKTAGNFSKMIREQLLFDNGITTEVQRLHGVVEGLLKTGRLQETPAWRETSTPASVKKIERRMRREREEAEEALKEMAGAAPADGDLNALQLAMQQRQQASWSSMMDRLETKYVEKEKSFKKRRRSDVEEKKQRSRHLHKNAQS